MSQSIRALLAVALFALLPLACNLRVAQLGRADISDQLARANTAACYYVVGPCTGDGSGSSKSSPSPKPPVLSPPPCGQLCPRIKATYHDPRTQELLMVLSQTPTGQGVDEYLLAMGAKLSEGFISWHDLHASQAFGVTTDGGFIQLDTSLWGSHAFGRYILEHVLVHETVESYFDVGEGIRQMGTRHADYVAQWFAGKFEQELYAIPYYQAQDPYYTAGDSGSAYGLSYSTWFAGTDDGQLYESEPATCNLRTVDRKGHAWPPSDWMAEQGGLWFLGQGADVTPVPDGLGLAPTMLVAPDLSVFSR